MEFEMVEVKIPKWLLVGIEKKRLVKDMKLFTAMRFYETNVLSLGKAAEFAGKNKNDR
jgi:predicted HTH domain antitoxin